MSNEPAGGGGLKQSHLQDVYFADHSHGLRASRLKFPVAGNCLAYFRHVGPAAVPDAVVSIGSGYL